MMYSIYFLKCPITNNVVYVGMTKDVVKRYMQHTRTKTDNKIKDDWNKDLKLKGLKPLLEIVETGLTKYDAEDREIYYISKFENLFNILNGGLMPPSQNGKKYTVQQKRNCFKISVLKKAVIQKTKEGKIVMEFEGVREAGRITGIDHRSIAQISGGKSKTRKSAGGYLWEYKK